jgi:RNA polymerase-binding transcription factor DksA
MGRSEHIRKIRGRLIKRRDEIFESHRLSEEARLALSEPDIEPEETAQKQAISDVLEVLDEQEEKEIIAINDALARMETGEYGSCRTCGKPISMERLEAIPWTTVCSVDASGSETR